MPTTALAGVYYPAGSDSFDPGRDYAAIADSVDGKVYRAYPVPPGGSRPTLTAADRGFLADVADGGTLERWTGTAWQVVGGTSGGSGGGSTTVSTVWAGWQASGAQPIASGSPVAVAFGTALSSNDSAVTRASSGAGHAFTLTQSRLWTVTACAQFAAATGGGRKIEIRAGSTVIAKAGDNTPVSGPWSRTVSRARRLPAGTTITVIVQHNQGASVALDPEGGPLVSIDFAGI